MAIFEVLVALTILGLVAVSAVDSLREASATLVSVHQSEERIADASQLMAAISLLSASDLEQRAGNRASGPYTVRIQPSARGVYRVRISSADAVLLETQLYRRPVAR